MRRLSVVMPALGLVAAGWVAEAQSLGEIAAREEARRAGIRQPARVYTNADLDRDHASPPPTPSASSLSPPATDAPQATLRTATADAVTGAAAPGEDEQDGVTPRDQQEPQAPSDRGEQYWRSRADLLRSRLAAKNREIEALRERLASFGGSTDPEKDITTQALTRAVGDLDAFNDEWLRFERLARERGVPDSWIR